MSDRAFPIRETGQVWAKCRQETGGRSGGKQTPKNRTYTVEDIAAILGIGKSSAYKLANSGEFQTIRIGNMIRISRKSFEDWLGMEENEE